MRAGVGNPRPVLISDAVSKDPKDGSTIQWVQLVMAGGGVLGIAHVGFVRILEEAGIRFLGIGGTSAGAINAALIAAVRKNPADSSWEKCLTIVKNCKFNTFEDGDKLFVKLRKKYAESSLSLSVLTLLKAVCIAVLNPFQIRGAWQKLGLHKGEKFYNWVAQQLENNDASTLAELQAKMQLDGIKVYRRNEAAAAPVISDASNGFEVQLADITENLKGKMHEDNPLKLVAAELCTQSMVVFPEDAGLFYEAPEKANPADFVRASMSVPAFFQPFKLLLPHKQPVTSQRLDGLHHNQSGSNRWEDHVGFKGDVPCHAVFCDGGTLSNFPIALFHTPGKPLLPTLGIRLGAQQDKPKQIKSPKDYIASMFDTSRSIMDKEFVVNNKDYVNLIANVDTSGFGWLQFELNSDEQEELLLRGMEAAVYFLKKWQQHSPSASGVQTSKWEGYKRLREAMAELDQSYEVTHGRLRKPSS